MDWARILAYVTGTVDQELLARNEYLRSLVSFLRAIFGNTSEAILFTKHVNVVWAD